MLRKCNKMQCIDNCLLYHVWKVDIWRFLNKRTAHLPLSLFSVFKLQYLIIVSVFFAINHAPSKYSLLMYSELEILIASLAFKQMSKQMCTRLKFPYVYVSHRIHRCVNRSLSAHVQGYHFATRIEWHLLCLSFKLLTISCIYRPGLEPRLLVFAHQD